MKTDMEHQESGAAITVKHYDELRLRYWNLEAENKRLREALEEIKLNAHELSRNTLEMLAHDALKEGEKNA